MITEHDYVANGSIYEKDMQTSSGVITEKDYLTNGNVTEKDSLNAIGVVTQKNYYNTNGTLITNSGTTTTDPTWNKVVQYGQPTSWQL